MTQIRIEYPDFFELVSSRYSCRAYTNAPVSHDEVMAILETARLAPSACNKQPWKFMVLTSEEDKNVVIDSYSRDWIKTAPVYIVALGCEKEAWHRGSDNFDATPVDLSIACEHICLAATSLGLGSCWVCNFDEEKLRAELNISEEWIPIAIIPIGYPDPEVAVPEKKRKTIDEIVQWGK